jgi:GTP-binding protein EngB required for normal cell division
MFGENQRRYFLSQLRHIEELMSSALQELDPDLDPDRLFEKVRRDATLAQRSTLADYLALLRFSLRRFMQQHELEDTRDPPSGLWAFRTAVSFARIAAEELNPRYWSGYGAVEPQAAAAGERFSAELKYILARIDGYLIRGDGVELKDRLAQLERVSEEAPLLAELARVIASHGLVELRAPLELLIERARRPRFEIAVFGRVSSGKSSLLNWWIGRTLLPTGVTPVTSVPTHITHGETPRARVTVAGAGEIVESSLEDLAQYVTESMNPRNTKQILNVAIEVPADRLEPGIELVDTPGLGSLAAAGASQTLEYLPRCDLGILLVEAGAPLSREDTDVARALMDAGSDVSVALSKADQLSAHDLERARSYAETEIAARLKVPVVVRSVSTLPGRTELATTWFEAEIAPRLARHREAADIALKRKIAVLRESVAAALDSRLVSTPAPQEPARPATDSRANRIAQARLGLDRTKSSMRGLRIAHAELRQEVSQALQLELARGWRAGDEGEHLRERVERAAQRAASAPGDVVTSSLQEIHEQLAAVLRQSGENAESLPSPRGRPLFELPPIAPAIYPRPRWLPPGETPSAWVAGRRIPRSLIESIEEQLLVHADALSRWGLEYLSELTREFNAAVATVESQHRSTDIPASTRELDALRQDLERLRRWPNSSSLT